MRGVCETVLPFFSSCVRCRRVKRRILFINNFFSKSSIPRGGRKQLDAVSSVENVAFFDAGKTKLSNEDAYNTYFFHGIYKLVLLRRVDQFRLQSQIVKMNPLYVAIFGKYSRRTTPRIQESNIKSYFRPFGWISYG